MSNTNTPLPVSAYSEEEWAATIRYAEEHASEWATRQSEPRPLQPLQPLAREIFEHVTAHNRAMAEFYRLNPPR